MITTPAETAIEGILTALSGPLDACSIDLARGDVAGAQAKLQEAMELLRRVRRELREG